MGIFNFFGSGEHKVFDYKPIYYNKEEDERKRMFGAVDGSLRKEEDRKQADAKGGYVPGSYLKGSFRGGNYQRTRQVDRRVHTIVGIITMLLVFIILIFIAKFFTLL
jgi:hypothetical protein